MSFADERWTKTYIRIPGEENTPTSDRAYQSSVANSLPCIVYNNVERVGSEGVFAMKGGDEITGPCERGDCEQRIPRVDRATGAMWCLRMDGNIPKVFGQVC